MKPNKITVYQADINNETYGTTYDLNDGKVVKVNNKKQLMIEKRKKRIRRLRKKIIFKHKLRDLAYMPVRFVGRLKKPIPMDFERDYDGVAPICPICKNFVYDKKHCVFCGQRFLETAESEKWFTPKTEQGKCFMCGSEVTIHISRVNGHKRYECGKCGSKVVS